MPIVGEANRREEKSGFSDTEDRGYPPTPDMLTI
jgi:hypothetical protein